MFMFTGPVLLLIATVCEWIMGNFFSMMASSMFAVFWLSFSLLKLPTLQLANAYSTTGNEAEGSASVEYNAAIGLYLVVWGAAFFMFWIFTTRINVAICSMFTCATSGIWTLSAAYFKVAAGDYVTAGHLQKVCAYKDSFSLLAGSRLIILQAGGALVFGAGVFGWYITFVIMSAEMGVFKNLPVGDLSHFWAKTDIEKGIREE
jgi:succinate-acetate transporter protein